MAINGCQKGKRGERLWRDELIAHGYTARRGQQFSGSPDSPDVICNALSHLHFEVKTVEKLNVPKAFEQATRDAGTTKTPVLVHKRSRGPWLVTVWSHDWFKFLEGKLCPENTTHLTKDLEDLEPTENPVESIPKPKLLTLAE
jgi:Holliday junction resolvase